jgi:hypothetical protein
MMLDPDRLRHVLQFDPESGKFTWLNPQNSRIRAGTPAGHVGKYMRIRIDGISYLAHRLAWLYMTGEWPSGQIDHVNCDKLDNRWSNLRDASPSQNNANVGPRARNTSGHKGVTWHKRNERWQVYLGRSFVGQFVSKDEAAEAYQKAAEERFGEFARA